MTPTELKRIMEDHRANPCFFDRRTMKLFGDTMRNYRVGVQTINTHSDDNVLVYALIRRKPNKTGLTATAYFRADTLARTWVKS